jgi:hypothetical protein
MRKLLGPFLAAALAAAMLLPLSAGQALASNVHCGDVITHDTKLDSDLTCPGDGLVIGADGITLDLGGHTLTGTGQDTKGVSNPGYDGVTIENGVVSFPLYGSTDAIALGTVADNTLRDLSLVGRAAIEAESFERGRIEDVELDAGGRGMNLLRADHARITNVRGGGGFNWLTLTGDDNRITGNVYSADGGIYFGGSRNVVSRNTADTFHPAIWARFGSGAVIEDNDLRQGGAFDSIVATNLRDSRISRNLGSPYDIYAVELVDSTGILLDHNDVAGISLTRSDDNRLLRNHSSHGWKPLFGSPGFRESGIFVDAESAANALLHNVASANQDDGIRVDNPDTRLIGNVANDNGDLGIEAVPGVKGAGNRASGNGNPAQCVPGYLCRTTGKPKK